MNLLILTENNGGIVISVRENRVIYFDYLRIISIFSVVVLHMAGQNWKTSDVNSFNWGWFNLVDSLVRWGVPVFVMISGALFLEKSRL